jgi:kumamolisin
MSDRKIFHDSVVPLSQQPGLTPQGMLIAAAEPHHGDEMMDVHFSLDLSQAAKQQLEERVAKGEVIPARRAR